MSIDYQIQLATDLINEDAEITISEYTEIITEISNVERAQQLNAMKIYDVPQLIEKLQC